MKIKVLVTFFIAVITNICLVKCENDWEPITHPNGGYSVQQSYVSSHPHQPRDDRKLPIIHNDVDIPASPVISPIAQDIDTLQELNKQNFIDDVSETYNSISKKKKQFKNSRSMTNSN